MEHPRRLPGKGWLVAIGGGEFSFGETLEVDRRWLELAPTGPIGFLPTASGSVDYADEFADYLEKTFAREVRKIPVFRRRDAHRSKNVARVDEVAAIYVGGGVADTLLEVLADSPVLEAMGRKLGSGGVVATNAAASQALGVAVRSLRGTDILSGLGWLPGGVVETNFDPAHDRRLRRLMAEPGVEWGLGLAAGSAIFLGPDGAVRLEGTSFLLHEPEGDFSILQ